MKFKNPCKMVWRSHVIHFEKDDLSSALYTRCLTLTGMWSEGRRSLRSSKTCRTGSSDRVMVDNAVLRCATALTRCAQNLICLSRMACHWTRLRNTKIKIGDSPRTPDLCLGSKFSVILSRCWLSPFVASWQRTSGAPNPNPKPPPSLVTDEDRPFISTVHTKGVSLWFVFTPCFGEPMYE
ncbi:hypothetical protein BDY19DRAFT_393694 [Irpex rosettiformis]|uniref:Uncharacterized protein n=1 Tax=Irpex rosettiformis TaxID=378272 RepID=A0ACB8TUQ2_9APHY|nr:hypothetical protein BDY19DRAFT_393694 [Irpex rosettiformis]